MGKKDSFSVGDLVFAKVKGYPAWPAKVSNIFSFDEHFFFTLIDVFVRKIIFVCIFNILWL